MNPGLVVKLRPSGPWRIGPDSGARNRVDAIYHSDSLYAAVTSAMARFGWLDEWLEATARQGETAVCFSSCFPFLEETRLIIPPRTIWPPTSPALMSTHVRWKSARFVPLGVVQAILAGKSLEASRWSVDGASQCLVPAGSPGPFRIGVRTSAAVDRLTGAVERHSTACIEFRPGCGLWTVASFRDEAALARWRDPVRAAFRLLADSGFGGERSRGWGRSEAPEFEEGLLPQMVLGDGGQQDGGQELGAEGQGEVLSAAVLAPETELPARAPHPSPEAPAEPSEAELVMEAESPAPGPQPQVPGSPTDLVPTPPPEPTEAELAMESESPAPVPQPLAADSESPAPGPQPLAADSESPAPGPQPLAADSESPAPGPQPLAADSESSAPGPQPLAPDSESPAPGPQPLAAGSESPAPGPQPLAADSESPEPGLPPRDPEPELPPAPEPAPEGPGEPGPPTPEPVPEPAPAPAPLAPPIMAQAHWLLSLFTPAAADAVDWRRGNYTVLARGGRVDSPAGSGELKKQIQMVAEGSVLYAGASPCGTAADVAPDGFPHPVFRAGFALSIPLPEGN